MANGLGKKKGLTAHEERVRIEGITERLKQKKKDTIKLRQQLKGIEVEPDNPLIQSQDQGIGTRPVEQEIEPLVESTDITTPQSPTGLGSPITSIGRGALRKAPLVALGVRGFAEAQKRFPETFSAIETELYEPLDLGLGRDEYPSGFEGGLAWAENLFGQAIKSGKDLLGIEDESKTLPRASSISSFSPKKILSKKGLGSRTLDENLLKGVLKREDGEPVVVYRGSESSEDQNIMNKIVRGEGRVDAWDDSGLAFFSDNPHVAESFAGSEGVMAPFLIKPKEVIEFKLRYLRGLGGERLSDDPFFDKLAFDKRASQLGKGQVLVARDVVDTGPRTAYRGEDPRYLTYGSDIYAMTDPDILVSAISPQEASKDDPDVPDIAALQQRIDELANEWKDKHPHIDAEREFDARQAKDEVEETRRFRDLFNRSYGERKEIAAWTDERLRSAIRTVEHGANIETKGQIGFVDPLDFLTATSSGQDAGRIMEEAGALDEARLKDETQTPYIVVENSAIIGHEGRHRMIAMARAGVSRVPILIKHRGLDDYTNFEFQEYQTFLSEEFFDGIRGGLDLTVTNLHSADSSQFGAIKEDIASHAAGIEFVVGGLITKQKNFQSGGLNMARTEEAVYDDTEDQMNMMGFEPQEQSIDTVSGNEIPLGGTAEGVRDNIDAKMSPGEMVIPEYAVNYHGVETYINSIQKAQQGYDQMQDMGLMGNPDEAIMDQGEPLPKMQGEDIPEYQFGGLASAAIPQLPSATVPAVTATIPPVTVPPVTAPTLPTSPSLAEPLRPTTAQVTPVTSPYPRGYFIQVGADQYKFVSPPGSQNQYTSTYTRAQVGNSSVAPVGTTPESVYGPNFQAYSPNYTLGQPSLGAGDYQVIPYTNSAGNIIYISSMGGQLQESVPAGYFPAADQTPVGQVDPVSAVQPVAAPSVGGAPISAVQPVTAPSIGGGQAGIGSVGGVSAPSMGPASVPAPSVQASLQAAAGLPNVMSPVTSVPTPSFSDIASTVQSQHTSSFTDPNSIGNMAAGLIGVDPNVAGVNVAGLAGEAAMSMATSLMFLCCTETVPFFNRRSWNDESKSLYTIRRVLSCKWFILLFILRDGQNIHTMGQYEN